MIVIGITGPTGAGKTTALEALEALGVRVLDCDAVYHRLLETCQPMARELTGRFGPVFVDGRLDRQRLGRAVWGDEQALADLNAITHKYILAQLDEEIAAARQAGLPGAAIDAIALLESGAAELCDTTVAVIAPEEERVRRIMAREGIDRDYALARARAQKPGEWFAAHCRHTLNNNGSREEFRQKALELFRGLLDQGNKEESSCQNKKS